MSACPREIALSESEVETYSYPMNDLREEVPDHTPDKDALIGYGLAVVGALPVFGSVIADISGGMLAQKREARQHEFNNSVAAAVEELSGRVNGLSPETLVASSEFLAAYEKVTRVAAETASDVKRARLARVLSNMGPWNDIEETKRQQFLDLVTRYDDIHVFLLRYFRAPTKWLEANAPLWDPNKYMMAGIGTILGEHVFRDFPDWTQTVEPVLAVLKADGLTDVSLHTSMSSQGTVEARNSQRGNDFLRFLRE
jgi:hypothetical protein